MVFSAGIWIGFYAWRPPVWWAIAIVACSLGACWFVRRHALLAKTLALGAWFLFGAFLIQVRGRPANDPRLAALADGRSVVLTAHVIREGYAHAAGPRSMRRTIDVESEEIESEGTAAPVRTGVRLTLYAPVEFPPFATNAKREAASGSGRSAGKGIDEGGGQQSGAGQNSGDRASGDDESATALVPASSVAFRYGTRLQIRAKLHAPRNFRNPGAFDYEGYLRDNGINMLASAEMSDVEPLGGFSGSRVAMWRARVHASIIRKIHEIWPGPQAALMDAMVLGEESFLRNATRTEFQRSGTYHLLVVSGMNLSILAFAIFWALRNLRFDPAAASVLTVVLSFAYAFVVGVGPPVWRAALMLAMYMGARLLYRERNMLNAIGAAAIGVLIVDPAALFGASFQLTFLAVFIIAGVGEPLLERSAQPYARGLRLLESTTYDLHVAPQAAQLRLDLRLIAQRLSTLIGTRVARFLPRFVVRVTIAVAELIFISTLMQAGLTILMAYHFHRATTMGVPANFGVIPLTQVLMPDGSGGGRAGVCVSDAGQTGGVDIRVGARGHHRNRALAWRNATGGSVAGRLTGCHAVHDHDCSCDWGIGARYGRNAAIAVIGTGLARVAGWHRIVDCFCSRARAHSSRSNGDDGD